MAALHLLYRTRPEDRRENGRHAVLVDAASEAAARVLAGVPDSWGAVQLAATATMPPGRTVIWLEGDAISLLGIDRGGNPVV